MEVETEPVPISFNLQSTDVGSDNETEEISIDDDVVIVKDDGSDFNGGAPIWSSYLSQGVNRWL
jgi:hypothetical protein